MNYCFLRRLIMKLPLILFPNIMSNRILIWTFHYLALHWLSLVFNYCYCITFTNYIQNMLLYNWYRHHSIWPVLWMHLLHIIPRCCLRFCIYNPPSFNLISKAMVFSFLSVSLLWPPNGICILTVHGSEWSPLWHCPLLLSSSLLLWPWICQGQSEHIETIFIRRQESLLGDNSFME